LLGIFGLKNTVEQDINQTRQIQELMRQQSRELARNKGQLKCLYAMANLVRKPNIPPGELLQGAIELIPTGLRQPESIGVRIIYKEHRYQTKNFRETPTKLVGEIKNQGRKIGAVEVYYLGECPAGGEKAFLDEEKALLNDITDRLAICLVRKNSDENLQATNDFLESIMESVSHAIYVIDLEGKFNLVSSAGSKITGYPVEELIDQPFAKLFTPTIFEEINKQFAKVKVLGGTVSHYETEIIRGDGKKVFVSLNFSPLFEKGKIVSIVGTAEDITQRRQLERQLLQAQKLESIGQLASGIAHEINTPIQYLGDNSRFLQESFAELIQIIEKYTCLLKAAQQGNIPPEYLAEAEEIIQKIDIDYLLGEIPKAMQQNLDGISRVAEIVQAMKEFSQPGVTGKTCIDINKALASTITVSRNEWKYVAEMQTDFDPDMPLVPCLPGEFNQIILNLIINAAQAILQKLINTDQAKGVISISTRRQGDWAEIYINDTGTGIPPEIHNRIFDPFFTTKTVGKSTGYGLSVCHNVIVEKHHGTIAFETEPGKGTTFIVRLPLNTDK